MAPLVTLHYGLRTESAQASAASAGDVQLLEGTGSTDPDPGRHGIQREADPDPDLAWANMSPYTSFCELRPNNLRRQQHFDLLQYFCF